MQPASLDLRLGDIAYRVRSSFLPGPEQTVAERIQTLELHRLDLTQGAVLERGCVYLVPLQESLALPPTVSAGANPKSSTGRLDVFTRVIGDRARGFDTLPAGYPGPLYLEISPRTFPVRVRTRLAAQPDALPRRRYAAQRSTSTRRCTPPRRWCSTPTRRSARASRCRSISRARAGAGSSASAPSATPPVIDMDIKDTLDVLDYWEPLINRGSDEFILDPDEFYILVSRESVHVPPGLRRRDGAVRSAGG